MKHSHAERLPEQDPIVTAWKERDEFEIRLAELERIVANQADIIHLLVQSTTILLKAQNQDTLSNRSTT